MNRRRITLLFLALLGIGVACGAFLPRTPVYAGRPLRAWLEDLDSTALVARETSSAMLHRAGRDVLPDLLDILRARDSRLKRMLVEWMGKQSVIRVNLTLARARHEQAIKACRAVGTPARPAIPELIGFLSDAGLSHEAAEALVTIDPQIFPLTRALTNGMYDAVIRAHIARRLASPRYDPKEVVPSLISSLADDHSAVRVQSALALGKLGRAAEAAVPALVDALRDPDSGVRKVAAAALKKIRAEAAANGSLEGTR